MALSRAETKAPAPQPVKAEPASAPTGDAANGAATYRVYCSVCHGRSGRGDGRLAEALRQRPADLTRLAQDNGGVFDAEKVRKSVDGRDDVIPHGDSDMPVWGSPSGKAPTSRPPTER